MLRLPIGRVEIIGHSDIDHVLPGVQAPVLPYGAAQTVVVADLAKARRLVEDNGHATRPTPSGLLVHATAPLIFTEES
jgi:hypothetical protein